MLSFRKKDGADKVVGNINLGFLPVDKGLPVGVKVITQNKKSGILQIGFDNDLIGCILNDLCGRIIDERGRGNRYPQKKPGEGVRAFVFSSMFSTGGGNSSSATAGRDPPLGMVSKYLLTRLIVLALSMFPVIHKTALSGE